MNRHPATAHLPGPGRQMLLLTNEEAPLLLSCLLRAPVEQPRTAITMRLGRKYFDGEPLYITEREAGIFATVLAHDTTEPAQKLLARLKAYATGGDL